MHRGAAEMDGWWRAIAGVFSSDAARSRAAGVSMGFDPERSYGDVDEMLRQEAQRPDGIDAVAIMTPNDTHYRFAAAALDAGLDVVGDKPVTHDFKEALRSRGARPARQAHFCRRARVFRVSDDALRAPPGARRNARDRSGSCRSNTSRAAWRRAWRRARRTIASAGFSIPSAADWRWS